MKIYLVQHGRIPSANEMKLTSEDEGLSEDGIKEVTEAVLSLKQQLGDDALELIISSPRKRTFETAEIFKHAMNVADVDVLYDERLVERDGGSFYGQPIMEVFSHSEEELVMGGMESLAKLYERSKKFYDELLERQMAGAILLVSHSGNVAPLYFAAKHKSLGDILEVPVLKRNEVLLLN